MGATNSKSSVSGLRYRTKSTGGAKRVRTYLLTTLKILFDTVKLISLQGKILFQRKEAERAMAGLAVFLGRLLRLFKQFSLVGFSILNSFSWQVFLGRLFHLFKPVFLGRFSLVGFSFLKYFFLW